MTAVLHVKNKQKNSDLCTMRFSYLLRNELKVGISGLTLIILWDKIHLMGQKRRVRRRGWPSDRVLGLRITRSRVLCNPTCWVESLTKAH